ncbi:MAG: Uma2 family endonuclease [Nitrospirae bacterium]|jgi:Uma2 family endonuclease|nr:Uma2 family endonuclease [Nitrospirota bacterium]MCL5062085.1 Uma2 family endonuclease [Nitrospirota bacterium]MDA8338974.1 Uma2 family endonuclease [Nitrospiraceae bacterium]
MTSTLLEKETIKKQYTYEDYEKLPEGAPYQLVGGELIMTPSPMPYHQIISRNIGFELLKFNEQKKLGEVIFAPMDVYLSETETYQPDIIFISKERLNIIGEKKIEAAPDLVIEILSPATAYYDLRHKKHVYEKTGVKEYWIVDPMEKSIEVYENTNSGFKLFNQGQQKGSIKSKLLEGFGVEIEKVF